MPTAGEGQMPTGVLPFDVEPIRVGKDGRITIGRGDVHHHQFALTDLLTRYLGVFQRNPCSELDR